MATATTPGRPVAIGLSSVNGNLSGNQWKIGAETRRSGSSTKCAKLHEKIGRRRTANERKRGSPSRRRRKTSGRAVETATRASKTKSNSRKARRCLKRQRLSRGPTCRATTTFRCLPSADSARNDDPPARMSPIRTLRRLYRARKSKRTNERRIKRATSFLCDAYRRVSRPLRMTLDSMNMRRSPNSSSSNNTNNSSRNSRRRRCRTFGPPGRRAESSSKRKRRRKWPVKRECRVQSRRMMPSGRRRGQRGSRYSDSYDEYYDEEQHEKKGPVEASHKSKSPEEDESQKKEHQRGGRGAQPRDQQRDSAGRDGPFRGRGAGRGGYDEEERAGKEQRPPRFQQKDDEQKDKKRTAGRVTSTRSRAVAGEAAGRARSVAAKGSRTPNSIRISRLKRPAPRMTQRITSKLKDLRKTAGGGGTSRKSAAGGIGRKEAGGSRARRLRTRATTSRDRRATCRRGWRSSR